MLIVIVRCNYGKIFDSNSLIDKNNTRDQMKENSKPIIEQFYTLKIASIRFEIVLTSSCFNSKHLSKRTLTFSSLRR